jgi:6-pyruvoyltetrahydropterin/6-carboxytetrahydropterin synthase
MQALQTRITRKIEFDAGHRIPNHESKCRNLHGHRYVLEVTVEGPVVITGSGRSDEGMVIDYGSLKSIATQHIGEPWDHALLLWDQDPIRRGLNLPPYHKTVLLPVVPTAENLARIAFETLDAVFKKAGVLKLVQVRLYETPNCWADYYQALPR